MGRSVGRMLVVAVVIAAAGIVLAQQTADVTQIVRDIEHNEFRFNDIHYKMKISLIEGGTTTREIQFEVWAKGSDKMLIKVLSPGEVAGTQILQLGARTMYMYNPEDHSVRVIATSARAQGFLGTDYAAADASLAGISDGWTPTLLETTDQFYKVQLVPQSSDVSPYSKLVVWYDRTRSKATKIEYYMDGELAKTIDRMDFITSAAPGTFNDFTRTTVTNARANRVTEVHILDWEVNTGLDDRMFTKRALMLGD